jgi:hypothetical protein
MTEIVECIKITKHNIYFECPFCVSSYKLNGEPRLNSKPLVHIHGNDGDFKNRTEHRGGHCKEIRDFNIMITDNTIRIN